MIKQLSCPYCKQAIYIENRDKFLPERQLYICRKCQIVMKVIFAQVVSCQHIKKSKPRNRSIIFSEGEKYNLFLKRTSDCKTEYLPKIQITTNDSIILEPDHNLILFFGCHQDDFSKLLYIYNENTFKVCMFFSPIEKTKVLALKVGLLSILLYFLLTNIIVKQVPKFSNNIAISVGFFTGAMTLMINLSRYYRLDSTEDKSLNKEQGIFTEIFEYTTRKESSLNNLMLVNNSIRRSEKKDINPEEKEVIVNRLNTAYDEIISLLLKEIEIIRGGSHIEESDNVNLSEKISNFENIEKQISELFHV